MKKVLLLSLLSLSLFVVLGVAAAEVQAQSGTNSLNPTGSGDTTGSGNTTGTGNPTGREGINFSIPNPFNDKVGSSLFGLMKAIINNVIMPIGGVLAVLGFIYAGFKYVTAGGNTTKIADANNALLFVSIGTAVLLGSWVLANAICRTINLLGGPVCPT